MSRDPAAARAKSLQSGARLAATAAITAVKTARMPWLKGEHSPRFSSTSKRHQLGNARRQLPPHLTRCRRILELCEPALHSLPRAGVNPQEVLLDGVLKVSRSEG